MSSYELNPPKQKGVNLEGLEGWIWAGARAEQDESGIFLKKKMFSAKICMDSGWMRVVRSCSRAKAPPLAAHPVPWSWNGRGRRLVEVTKGCYSKGDSQGLPGCSNPRILWIKAVTVDSMEGFHHFEFLRHGFKLATFFIEPKNSVFWGSTSFELIKNLATLNPEKLQGFHGTPLYHCYTLRNVTSHPRFSESGGKRARKEVLGMPTFNFQ